MPIKCPSAWHFIRLRSKIDNISSASVEQRWFSFNLAAIIAVLPQIPFLR